MIFFLKVVGFVFHACLLLVLTTWRPSGDDPALFHVISAAWGVCNSIWETLIYSKLYYRQNLIAFKKTKFYIQILNLYNINFIYVY